MSRGASVRRRWPLARQASGNDPGSSPNRPGDEKSRPLELARRLSYNERHPDERRKNTDHPRLQHRGEARKDAEQDAEARGDVSGAAEICPTWTERKPRWHEADCLSGVHEMRKPNRDQCKSKE